MLALDPIILHNCKCPTGMCSMCFKTSRKQENQSSLLEHNLPQETPDTTTPTAIRLIRDDTKQEDVASKSSAADDVATSSPTLQSTKPDSIRYEPSTSGSSESEATAAANAHVSASTSDGHSTEGAVAKTAEENSGPGKAKKPKKNRCHTCSKKVGLLGFKCRCGGEFCPTHRYSDKHDCTFDYKTYGREILAKANQKCVAEKTGNI